MVLPFLSAAGQVAGGVGAIAGIFQGNAQARAARASNNIAMRNYLLQREIANEQREMARAGSIDARGNRTEFIPGVGWVTRTSDATRGLIGASDAEERARLTSDATRGRIRRQNTFTRQLNEGAEADATLASREQGQQTLDGLRGAMIEAGVARAMSGANDARGRIGLVSLRQGTGGEQALAQLARSGLADTRTAIAEANLEAPGEFVARRGARENSALNRYNVLSFRATAPDDVPFQPTQLDEDLSQILRTRMATAPQALGSAANIRAPEMRNTESRIPVGIAGLGQYLQQLARSNARSRTPSGGTSSNWGSYSDFQGYDDFNR